MNKKVKSLILGLVVVAVLAAALVLLKNTKPAADTSSSQSSAGASAIVISDKKQDDISIVKVKNSKGELVIKQSADNNLYVDELAGLPVNNLAVMSVATQATSLSPLELVDENPSDISAFGLDKLVIETYAEFKDGSTVKMKLGNKSPANVGVYASFNDENKVYIMSTQAIGSLDFGLNNLVTLELTETITDNSAVKVNSIELGGTLRSKPLRLEAVETTAENEQAQGYGLNLYKMVSPLNSDINSQAVDVMIASAFGMNAETAAVLNPSAQQLAEYGLSNPYSTLLLNYGENKQVSIKVSQPNGGYVYALKDDIKIIYKLSTEKLKWIETLYPSVISRLVLLPNIETVEKVTVSSPEKTYVFELSGKDDKFIAKYGNTLLDAANFKKFYQVLLSISRDSVAEGTPSGKPALTIKYQYFDGRVDTIELVPAATRKMQIVVNGQPDFYTLETNVDKILSDVEKVIADKPVNS